MKDWGFGFLQFWSKTAVPVPVLKTVLTLDFVKDVACVRSIAVWQGYGQGYGQMPYPYGQGQYGQAQDASMTGQQGQQPPGGATAQYGAQQQMPYGQMRTFFCAFFVLTSPYACVVVDSVIV